MVPVKEVLARRLVRETRVVACGQVFERYQETSTREPPGDLGKGVGSHVQADWSNVLPRLQEWEILAKGGQVCEASHAADPAKCTSARRDIKQIPARQATGEIWKGKCET